MYKVKNPIKTDRVPVNTKSSVIFHEIENHASAQLISELASVGDTLEQMAWRCGWKVNELYEDLLANGYAVDYLEVCNYVSVVSLRSQRSPNTVKKWALTARFFQPHVAKKYGHDVLPFSHFAYAASFDDQVDHTGRCLWQKVLEHSWNHYTNPANGIARHLSMVELQEYIEGKPPKTKSTVHHGVVHSFFPSSVTALDPVDMDKLVQDDLAEIQIAIHQFESVLRGLLPRISHKNPLVASGLAGVLNLLGKVKKVLNSNRESSR